MSKDESVESTGERVYLTKDNDDTYDSEVIEWFMWRRRPDSEDYNLGQLLVSFYNTTVYTYNVGYNAYSEMRDRAFSPDEYNETPFGIYDEKMIEWVEDTKRSDSSLYEDKLCN